METLDLKTRFKYLYFPSAKAPSIVDVPRMRVLAIDGAGKPGDEAFQQAMGALFSMAYGCRFGAKKALGLDYPVMASEGLYRSVDGGPLEAASAEMGYTLQIMVPDELPAEFVEQVREQTAARKDVPRLAEVELRDFDEGTCVTMLHVGPYATEPGTIERMTAYAREQGYDVVGEHHEVYLSDPGRTTPERLKTALRFGVRKAG